MQLPLRVPVETPRGTRSAIDGREGGPPGRARRPTKRRYARVESRRAEAARGDREQQPPAYVVFHDATLAEMARSQRTRAIWRSISGVGAKKLEAYGREILRVLGDHNVVAAFASGLEQQRLDARRACGRRAVQRASSSARAAQQGLPTGESTETKPAGSASAG